MRVLGLVPARGGSKGIPGKNLKLLGGKPLLEHTSRTALSSARLTRVILSTDDEAIAELGRTLGLDVPFMRPAELASDETPMSAVVRHAVEWLERKHTTFDAVCLLQPTSPFRRAEDVDACIEIFEGGEVDSVVSVVPVPARFNPHWTFFRSDAGLLELSTGEASLITRRQDLPPAYHRDGAIYVFGWDLVRSSDSLLGDKTFGYRSDPERSVNLDEPEDWERAERMLQ